MLEDESERWVRWLLRAGLSWCFVGACYLTRAVIESAATQVEPFPTIFRIVLSVATSAAVAATCWSVGLWWTTRRGRVFGQRD